MSIQVLLGIFIVKFITILNGVICVPLIGVSCLLVYNTLALGAAMASVILFFTLSGVGFLFLARKIRYQITIIIRPSRLIILLLLGSGILVFMSCAIPVIPGL